jgi:hypothetical protein
VNPIVVAVCTIGLQSGDFRCHDTQFESQHVIDCQDAGRPAQLSTAERGGGFMRLGNIDLISPQKIFTENHAIHYTHGGWYVIVGNVTQVLLVVDEDQISRGSFEGGCASFSPAAP